MIDHLSPQPHVSNTRFRQAIKKYFYKDIEPEYTQQIKNLIVGDAIETLDTLQELAAALDDDAEFYQTVTTKFNNLTQTVTNNELVTAAALNDLNSRLEELNQTIEDNELVTASALVDLDLRKQEVLTSGVNVKTVNGETILGTGDITITTSRPFNSSWRTNTTLANFCADVMSDSSVLVGNSYLGELTCSGLPTGMMNGEVRVDVVGTSNSKILLLTVTSTNLEPYHWEMTYIGSTLFGWRSWALIDKAEEVTPIVAPVNQSNASNPITTLTCEVGKYYRIDVPIETLSITLPAMTNVTTAKTITLFLTGGTTPNPQFASADTGVNVYFADGFEVQSGNTYEISCLWNGLAWIVASVKIVTSNS